jgi:hypothetical protein
VVIFTVGVFFGFVCQTVRGIKPGERLVPEYCGLKQTAIAGAGNHRS